jgi:hypothetical protein
MESSVARHLWLACAVALAASVGCERGAKEGSQFDENVEKAVGDPQKSTGMLGGNSAPDDASCCTEARDAGSD